MFKLFKNFLRWFFILCIGFFPNCIQAAEINHCRELQNLNRNEIEVTLKCLGQLRSEEWNATWAKLAENPDRIVTLYETSEVPENAIRAFQKITVKNYGVLNIKSSNHSLPDSVFRLDAPKLRNYRQVCILTDARENKITLQQDITGSLILQSQLRLQKDLVRWHVRTAERELSGRFNVMGAITFESKHPREDCPFKFSGYVDADYIRFLNCGYIGGDFFSKRDIEFDASRQVDLKLDGKFYAKSQIKLSQKSDVKITPNAELLARKKIDLGLEGSMLHEGKIVTSLCHLDASHSISGTGALYAACLEMMSDELKLTNFKLNTNMAYLFVDAGKIDVRDVALIPTEELIIKARRELVQSKSSLWNTKKIVVDCPCLNLKNTLQASDLLIINSEKEVDTHAAEMSAKNLYINAPEIKLETLQKWKADRIFLKIIGTSFRDNLFLNSLPKPFSKDLDILGIYLEGGKQYSNQTHTEWLPNLRYHFVSSRAKSFDAQGNHRFDGGYIETDNFSTRDCSVGKLTVLAKMIQNFGSQWTGQGSDSVLDIKSDFLLMADMNLGGVTRFSLSGETHHLHNIIGQGTSVIHSAKTVHLGNLEFDRYVANSQSTYFSGVQRFKELYFGSSAQQAHFAGKTTVTGRQSIFLFDGEEFYTKDKTALVFQEHLKKLMVKARENITLRSNLTADAVVLSAGQRCELAGKVDTTDLQVAGGQVILAGDVRGKTLQFEANEFKNTGQVTAGVGAVHILANSIQQLGDIKAKGNVVLRAVHSYCDGPRASVSGANVSLEAERIEQHGEIKAHKDLLIKAIQEYVNHKTSVVAAGGNATFDATTIVHLGRISAQKDLLIQAKEKYQNGVNAQAKSGRDLEVHAGTVDQQGQLEAGRNVLIEALGGYISSETASLKARGVHVSADAITQCGKIKTDGDVVLKAVHSYCDGPRASVSGANVSLEAERIEQHGEIKAHKDLLIKAIQEYVNHKTSVVAAGGNATFDATTIVHLGRISAQKDLLIQAKEKYQNGVNAQAKSGGVLEVQAVNIDQRGRLEAVKNIAVNALNKYIASETASLKAHNINISADNIKHFGRCLAEDTLTIKAIAKYADRQTSINEAGQSIVLNAPKTEGFNGKQKAKSVTVHLDKMPFDKLLLQVESEELNAHLNQDVTFSENTNIPRSLGLWVNNLTVSDSVHTDGNLEVHAKSFIIKNKKDNQILFISKGNMNLEFYEGFIENSNIQSEEGRMDLKVLKSLTLLPGCNVRESSTRSGSKTTHSYQKTYYPSVIHGKQGLTIYLETGTKLINIASTLSSEGRTEIVGDSTAKQTHLAAGNIQTMREHKKASWFSRYILGSGDRHTQRTRTTIVSPTIKGLVVHMEGGEVTLQSAIVESDTPIIDVDQLWLKAAVDSVKREHSGQDGYIFVSVSTTNKSHQEILRQTQFINSNGQDLIPDKVTVKSKKPIHIENAASQRLADLNPWIQKLTQKNAQLDPITLENWYTSSSNFSLTPLSKLGIALVASIATQGTGASLLFGEAAATASTFATTSLNAVFTTAVTQGATAGLSLAIGDENWRQNILSRDALCHLVLGSLVTELTAEVGTALIPGFDPQILPKFFDNPARHMMALGLRELGYVIKTLPTGQEWNAKGFLGRCVQAEIDTVAKHVVTEIGQANQRGTLSNFEHKFSHGLAAFWTQGASSITEGMIDPEHFSPYQLILSTTAATLGAVGAEIIAEQSYHSNLSKILQSSEPLNAQALRENLLTLGRKSANAAKYATVAMGILFANENSLRACCSAGAHAIDNNFIMESLAVASFAWTIHDTYQAYKKSGVDAAVLSLVEDVATTMVAGCVIKAGAKTFKRAVGIVRQKAGFDLANKAVLQRSTPGRYDARDSMGLIKLNKNITSIKQASKLGGDIKFLANDRVRYYGKLRPAEKLGKISGRRQVIELNFKNKNSLPKTREWHECLDSEGKLRIIRPKRINGIKIEKPHYEFDQQGKFIRIFW